MRRWREDLVETALVRAGTRLVLRVVVGAAIIVALWRVRLVVSWTVVALLLALTAHPVVDRLRRAGIGRGLAVSIVVVAGLTIGALALRMFVPLLVDQAGALVDAAPDLLDKIRRSDAVEWADARFSVVQRAEQWLRDRGPALALPALGLARDVLEIAFGAITVVTLTVLLLLTGDELFVAALSWIEPGRRVRVRALALSARRMVSRYVLGTLIVATVGGFVMGTTLALLGVPYYLPVGIVLIFLGLIPYIGGYLGALIVIVMAGATRGMRAAIVGAVVYVVYQQIEGNVLQPAVQQRTVRMNPALVALAILVGAALAGILGALVAIPVAATFQIVLRELHRGRQRRWSERTSRADGTVPEAAQGLGTRSSTRSPSRPSRATSGNRPSAARSG